MPRTRQIILQGGIALAIIAGTVTYFYAAKPAPAEPPAAPIMEQISAEDTQTLLTANACLGCHAADKKLVDTAIGSL